MGAADAMIDHLLDFGSADRHHDELSGDEYAVEYDKHRNGQQAGQRNDGGFFRNGDHGMVSNMDKVTFLPRGARGTRGKQTKLMSHPVIPVSPWFKHVSLCLCG